MKNKLLPIIITSLFIIIFIFFYKGLKNSNIYTPETKINIKVPSFDGELFHEKKIINSSKLFQVDKYYLLNIWSSWCVPCKQEHPLLMNLGKNKNIKLIESHPLIAYSIAAARQAGIKKIYISTDSSKYKKIA